MLFNVSKKISMVMLALALPVLQGCEFLNITGEDGFFRDRQGDYLTAPVAPPLEVPPELDSFTLVETFPIPEEVSLEGGHFLIPPPPRGLDTRVREGVVIQSFTERRWILIGATPGQVWPRLRDFWATAQTNLSREDAVRGIMETEWVDLDGQEARQKYVVRIEPGLHPGNSEIYVINVDENKLSPGFVPGSVESSHNPEVEEQMLNAISVYLADRTDLYRASSVSLLAGSIEVESKARIVRAGGGNAVLELDIDYERAWGQVGQSLADAGLNITDSDRSEGRLKVLFSGVQEEEGPGFFGRLFGRGDSEEASQEFEVRLEETDDTIRVSVESLAAGAGQELEAELIQVINDNLS